HDLADEVAEVDPESLAAHRDLDAVVDQALLPQAVGDTRFLEQGHRALLKHTGTDAALDIGAVTCFQDDAVDAVDLQEARQQQAGRPGADDADLRARRCHQALMPPSTISVLPVVKLLWSDAR